MGPTGRSRSLRTTLRISFPRQVVSQDLHGEGVALFLMVFFGYRATFDRNKPSPGQTKLSLGDITVLRYTWDYRVQLSYARRSRIGKRPAEKGKWVLNGSRFHRSQSGEFALQQKRVGPLGQDACWNEHCSSTYHRTLVSGWRYKRSRKMWEIILS